MQYTIFGGDGFIGSHIMRQLAAQNIPCMATPRDARSHLDKPLGHVLYCIGLTADFRERPFDTVEAHVHVLGEILKRGDFDSLTYLSSTRVYQGATSTRETESLLMNILDPGGLFNISKLLGESLCLWGGRQNVKIVRVSNVVGQRRDIHVFLDQVLHEAFTTGEVTFQTAPDSCKDFIHIDDVAAALPRIAAEGRQAIYNVAAGANVTNQWIGDFLSSKFGIKVHYAPNARSWQFAPIDISRLQADFGFAPRQFSDYIAEYVDEFRKRYLA